MMRQMSGPGNTRFTREAYAMAIRMTADNYRRVQILKAIHKNFPDHRPGEEREVTAQMLWHLATTRRDEIDALREELNRDLKDLWIANKRQRLVSLQEMFEDCNRWVPKKIIEPPWKPSKDGEDKPKPLVVFEKNVAGMLGVLKQAREELGETAADKTAQSLQDLVRFAEEQRGLERTKTIDAHPTDAVEYLEEAKVAEIEPPSRSKGADKRRGFLDGADPMLNDDATLRQLEPGEEESTPTAD